MTPITRDQIEKIQPGDLGWYAWNKTLPVCRVGETREVLAGPAKGRAFRYIEVQDTGATIGFTICEGDRE